MYGVVLKLLLLQSTISRLGAQLSETAWGPEKTGDTFAAYIVPNDHHLVNRDSSKVAASIVSINLQLIMSKSTDVVREETPSLCLIT